MYTRAMAQAPQPRRPGVPKAPARPAAKKPGLPAPKPKTLAQSEEAAPEYDIENAKTVTDEPVIDDADIVSTEAADDELALQANAPAADECSPETKAHKKFRPIRRPEDLEGRPSTITDTTPYLVIGGGVLAVIVLGSIVYMFMGPAPIKPQKPPATTATNQESPAPKATSNTPAPTAMAAKTQESAPAADPGKSSAPVAAPAGASDGNQACYFASINFLIWARDEGLEWTPPQLTARFRTDVTRKGVTDTDVSDFASKVEALLDTGLNHPMNPQERMTFSVEGTHGGREILVDDAVRKHYELMDQIKLLTMKLRKRYGNPPPLPEGKTEAPPEEKPITTTTPSEAAPAPEKRDPNQK